MAENSRDPFLRLNNPIMWGVLATASVIVFGVWAATQSVCQTDFWGNLSCDGSKWSVFLEAAPNEVADTLAGFAGALAFVWLIATVWLQGQELAAQREELREQREATQEMAAAQTEQVKLLTLQGKIFESEQRQRNELEVKDILDERLRILALKISSIPICARQWRFMRHDDGRKIVNETTQQRALRLSVFVNIFSDRTKDHSIEEQLSRWAVELKLVARRVAENSERCEKVRLADKYPGYTEILKDLHAILALRDDLSHAQKIRVNGAAIPQLAQDLEQVLANEVMWSDITWVGV